MVFNVTYNNISVISWRKSLTSSITKYCIEFAMRGFRTHNCKGWSRYYY